MASTDLATQQRLLSEIDTGSRNRAQIRIWLGVVVLALFALVLVGGATRLTDSGLSITEWKPIHGVIPPLTERRVARGIRALPAHSAISSS